MGFTKNGAALVLLLTAAAALIIGSSGDRMTTTAVKLWPRVYVNIWNRMPQGNEVSVHCKSKDDDLGDRGAGTDVAISFDFKPNALLTTQFDCVAVSKYGVTKFVVYRADRDSDERCVTQCDWNVREDGFHGVDQKENREDLFIPWGSAL